MDYKHRILMNNKGISRNIEHKEFDFLGVVGRKPVENAETKNAIMMIMMPLRKRVLETMKTGPEVIG